MNTGQRDFSKRTQKDYSLAFKLQVVDDVEKGRLTYKQVQAKYGIQGRSTVLVWLRKHGTLDWKSKAPMKKKAPPRTYISQLEGTTPVFSRSGDSLPGPTFLSWKPGLSGWKRRKRF